MNVSRKNSIDITYDIRRTTILDNTFNFYIDVAKFDRDNMFNEPLLETTTNDQKKCGQCI